MSLTEMDQRVILPLDFPDADQAWDATEELFESLAMVKVGLQLFLSEGPEVVERFNERVPVFLDLKLHDIPQTVERAVRAVAELGAEYMTVHAAGGTEMLRRAVDAAGSKCNIVAVTALTSLDCADLPDIGVSDKLDTTSYAVRLAVTAYRAGVRAFVCSPHEIAAMREAFGNDIELLVPGIRLKAAKDDQKRVATPSMAVKSGADFLVIGRPILESEDPYETLRKINKSVTKTFDEAEEMD